MLPLTLIAAGFAIGAGAAAESSDDGWHRFEPPEQPFAVFLPNDVQRENRTTSTIVGSVDTSVWKAKTQDAQFSVSVTDLPTLAGWFSSDEGLYEKARDKMMEELGGSAAEVEPIEKGPFEQRLRYRVPGKDGQPDRVGQALMSAEGDEIVVVNGLVEPDSPVSLDDFFLGVAVYGEKSD